MRNLGKYDEAIAQYSEALRINPDDADAHYNLGDALRNLGKYDEAAARYSEALRLKPDYLEARRSLEDLVRRTKSPNPAMRDRAKR